MSIRRSAPAERLLGGRYRLVERVDAGGAGEVWRATDERLGRDVAVKLLGPRADEAFRERFADEARRAAAVAHPNVVTVYDEGRDGDDAYMVMEYVRGRTLRDVVSQRGPLPAHESARLVSQVAAALDAAHAVGIVHCDVKPANVIVDDEGRAKLTDFGVARAARDPAEHELIGTARYIAPERVTGGAATARSDVFALALVAYELLAGQPAYAGVDTEELLQLRLAGPPPSLRAARLGLSDDLDRVITKGLSRDPAQRHASAGAFATALSAAAEHGERTKALSPPVRALPARRGVPGIGAVLALVAVGLVVAGTVLFFAAFARADRGPAAVPTQPAAGATQPAATASRGAPNVVGKSVTEAANELIAAGLHSPVSWQVDASARGTACAVVRQEPAAGASFQPGAVAQLYLAPGKDCGKKDD
ncbi:MAG: serine/threonine-protein kinase [Candidatus Limnocylindria bacterium]